VKQAIAWQRIIPFYNFFGRQDKQFDSPGGALFLHWIFTVIPLVSLSPTADTHTFASGFYSYGYQLVMVFLGLGLFRLKKRMRLMYPNWTPTYMKNRFTLYPIALVFIGSNIVIMVITAMPRSPNSIPRFYWPITILAVISAALVYWGALMIMRLKWGQEGGTLGAKIGFEVHVYEKGDDIPENMRFLMWEASEEGSRRRLKYKISGPVKVFFDGYRWAVEFAFKHLGYEKVRK